MEEVDGEGSIAYGKDNELEPLIRGRIQNILDGNLS